MERSEIESKMVDLLVEELGHLQTAGRVGRIELRHLAQQLERIASLAFAVIAVGGGLQSSDGLGLESHPLIQIGERHVGRVRAARIQPRGAAKG